MTRLTDDFLRGIRPRVFQDKTTTLSEVGRDIPVADFRETVDAIRAEMRATLATLPDAAYSEQQAGEGEAVWAAGQVTAHVSNSFHGMTGQVRTLLNMEETPQAERLDLEQRPDRAASLATLDQLDSDTAAFFAGLPADGDYARTVSHPRFGEIDSKGWLTLVTMHENDHLGQLRGLNGEG
ncbi:MAG TPA: DinB family protein [Thermomicrobiales bacterium]|nr:DinB family protein [Thermomicrobiales bacterium]